MLLADARGAQSGWVPYNQAVGRCVEWCWAMWMSGYESGWLSTVGQGLSEEPCNITGIYNVKFASMQTETCKSWVTFSLCSRNKLSISGCKQCVLFHCAVVWHYSFRKYLESDISWNVVQQRPASSQTALTNAKRYSVTAGQYLVTHFVLASQQHKIFWVSLNHWTPLNLLHCPWPGLSFILIYIPSWR